MAGWGVLVAVGGALNRWAGRKLVGLRGVCACTQDGDYGVQWKSCFLWRLAGVIVSFGGVWAVVKMHVGALENSLPS